MWGKKSLSLLEEARAISGSCVRATLADRESVERGVARARRKIFFWAVLVSFVLVSAAAVIIWTIVLD